MRLAYMAAGVIAISSVASADTLKVPQQFETIQAAVDAANDGDTIAVARGVYNENVVLEGKNNIRFVGKKAVWDGNLGGSNGNCLTATGDRIAVQGFRFRLGSTQINIVGDQASVSRCVLRGANTDGVAIAGNDATVVSNTIRGANSDGVEISGTGARVQKNRVSQCGSEGIDVSGAGARVERNTVVNVEDGNGISVSGDDALVVRNSVRITDDEGINVSGNDAVVDRNRCSLSGDAPGMQVSGDRFEITRNRIEGVADDEAGLDVNTSTVAGGGLIERNLIFDTAESGIEFSGNNVTIRSNRVFRAAAEEEASYDIDGDSNTVVGNQAIDGDGDGFLVSGAGNKLISNVARECLKDGFDIDGDGNSLERCTALNCDAEGLDNGGTNTEVRNCSFRGNRIDVTRDVDQGASFAMFSGNNFGSGGEDTRPEED